MAATCHQKKKALGDLFYLHKLLDAFPEQLSRCTVSFLTSESHESQPYVYVAQRTGGDVHPMGWRGTPAASIRTAIMKVINGWLGLEEACCHAHRRIFAPGAWTQPELEKDQKEDFVKLLVQDAPSVARPRSALACRVKAAERRIRRHDEAFITLTYDTLLRVIRSSPMAIPTSPILGRCWRMLCNRRKDARRDPLVSEMQRAQQSLPHSDREEFAAWIKKSFDATEDIVKDLREHIRQHGVVGVIRYQEEDTFHPQAIAEAFLSLRTESLSMITGMLARLTVDMNVVVPAAQQGPDVAVCDDDDDEGEVVDEEEELPIPAGSIPANLPPATIFQLLFHTAAPGTTLSKRMSAILAVMANATGSVVAPMAKQYLQEARGSWLNFLRNPAEGEVVAPGANGHGSPQVPENFNQNLVYLLQSHDRNVAATGADGEYRACTPAEAVKLECIRRVAACLRFSRLELKVETADLFSLDACAPDDVLTCASCHQVRSFTIIAADGRCGYCHAGRPMASEAEVATRDCGISSAEAPARGRGAAEVPARGRGGRGAAEVPARGRGAAEVPARGRGIGSVAEEVPAAEADVKENQPAPGPVTAATTFQVMCHLCRVIYHRDRAVTLRAQRTKCKCHYCQKTKEEAPCVTCEACGWRYLTPMKAFPTLPDGTVPTTCASCRAGKKAKILKSNTYAGVPASELFPLAQCWKALYSNLGLEPMEPGTGPIDGHTGISVPDALQKVRFVPAPAVTAALVPWNATSGEKLKYRERVVTNAQELWSFVIKSTRGRTVDKPTCSLCMESFAPSKLQAACGRRGCDQRLCAECHQSWYGAMAPGGDFLPRHASCPFCNRTPIDSVAGRVNPELITAIQRKRRREENHWDLTKNYSWCSRCHDVIETGEQQCEEAPAMLPAREVNRGFVCNDCQHTSTRDVPSKRPVKDCPHCNAATMKDGGCNHITCGACHKHWCWECCAPFGDAGATYAHMRASHGRFFDGEEPWMLRGGEVEPDDE